MEDYLDFYFSGIFFRRYLGGRSAVNRKSRKKRNVCLWTIPLPWNDIGAFVWTGNHFYITVDEKKLLIYYYEVAGENEDGNQKLARYVECYNFQDALDYAKIEGGQ